mgnify:CR=1 FL=1
MFYEKKEKTPDEKLAIAKIQVMMEDAFGILSNSESSPALQDRAKHWFDTADCSMWCDMAGTNQEYIKKLFDNLQKLPGITCVVITHRVETKYFFDKILEINGQELSEK